MTICPGTDMPLDHMGFMEEYLNLLNPSVDETRNFFRPIVKAFYEYRLKKVNFGTIKEKP